MKFGDYRIVIMNTNKRRELADSKYNERFVNAHCLEGTTRTRGYRKRPHHRSFDELPYLANFFCETCSTCRQLVSGRCCDTCLKEGDLAHFGRLMKQVHLSTELDYEVTGKEPTRWCIPALEQAGVLTLI